MRLHRFMAAVFGAATFFAGPALAQQDEARVEPVIDGISLAIANGVNVIVSAGEDGVLLVEAQDVRFVPTLREQIATITDKPVRIVIDTHWHSDHVGGNETFMKLGAVTIAQENTGPRMLEEQISPVSGRGQEAFSEAALPMVTFSDSATVHFNGQTVEMRFHPHAHTDSDISVWFREANVMVLSDIFTGGGYSILSVGQGGTFDGMIAAYDDILELIDEETKVIGWRGPVSTKADVAAYRDALVTIRDRINALISEGKSEEEVIVARPTAEFDARYGADAEGAARHVQRFYHDLKGTYEETTE